MRARSHTLGIAAAIVLLIGCGGALSPRSFAPASGEPSRLPGDAILVGSTVYVAAQGDEPWDGVGVLDAVDAATGALRWRNTDAVCALAEVDGVVYAHRYEARGASIIAIRASDGETLAGFTPIPLPLYMWPYFDGAVLRARTEAGTLWIRWAYEVRWGGCLPNADCRQPSVVDRAGGTISVRLADGQVMDRSDADPSLLLSETHDRVVLPIFAPREGRPLTARLMAGDRDAVLRIEREPTARGSLEFGPRGARRVIDLGTAAILDARVTLDGAHLQVHSAGDTARLYSLLDGSSLVLPTMRVLETAAVWHGRVFVVDVGLVVGPMARRVLRALDAQGAVSWEHETIPLSAGNQPGSPTPSNASL